jgi:sphingomyelin phosphodiesterase acid-like 3
MSKFSGCLSFLMLGNAVLISGCGAGNTAPVTPPSGPSTYTVVAISDIHFNPLADPTLFTSLKNADVNQWQAIFAGDTNSSAAAPSKFGADTNYPALVLALAALKQNLGSSPVILFSGDVLGHDLSQCFYELDAASTLPAQLNPATCPLIPSPAPSTSEVAAMQGFLDKTLAFVAMQIRANAGKVPIIVVPGNTDTYSIYGTGPDATFLSDNVTTYFTQLLNSSVDQASFRSTFTTLGSYSAQPLGSNLRIIALDSNPFAQSTYVPPLNPYAELTWLDSELAAAQAAGQKVWLITHVPPGANTTGTAQNAATGKTPNPAADGEAVMMWQPQYQLEFLQILSKYPGLIAMGITGHTHMDEFRVMPTGDVLLGIPGISPVFGNNPAFKIFTISEATQMPVDYQSIYFDLNTLPAQFSNLYTFSTAYGASANTSLESSLQQLYPQLTQSAPATAAFINYYDSGNAGLIPVLNTPWNMAGPANWSFFSCGLSQMDEQDYVDCVNY